MANNNENSVITSFEHNDDNTVVTADEKMSFESLEFENKNLKNAIEEIKSEVITDEKKEVVKEVIKEVPVKEFVYKNNPLDELRYSELENKNADLNNQIADYTENELERLKQFKEQKDIEIQNIENLKNLEIEQLNNELNQMDISSVMYDRNFIVNTFLKFKENDDYNTIRDKIKDAYKIKFKTIFNIDSDSEFSHEVAKLSNSYDFLTDYSDLVLEEESNHSEVSDLSFENTQLLHIKSYMKWNTLFQVVIIVALIATLVINNISKFYSFGD